MVISLGWLSPATSRGLPAAQTTRAGSRCLLGLAPTGGYRATPVARRAVGSYPTVSPLPLDKGRSVFCGPFRRLSAPRRYLAVCPVELGLSSMRPFSRRTATIAPHPLQAPKLPSRAALGQAGGARIPPLLDQSAHLAPHAVARTRPRRQRRGAAQPESVVLVEERAPEPGPPPRRHPPGGELEGGDDPRAPLLIAAHHGAHPDFAGEEQHRISRLG